MAIIGPGNAEASALSLKDFVTVPPEATLKGTLRPYDEQFVACSSGNTAQTPGGNPKTPTSNVAPGFPEIPFTVIVTASLVAPGDIGGKLEGDNEAV